MTEKTLLGSVLLQDCLITQDQLHEALNKQEQSAKKLRWQLLGEVLVQSQYITSRDLLKALEKQTKLNEVEIFGTSAHHLSVTNRLKRVLDILGATVGVTIMTILLPAIAIAIYLDSAGPIFLSHRRVGLRGKQFRIWKFRTMTPNAESYKLKVNREEGYKFFNNREDPQVTRVGRILRRTRLDEMLQFFNVLRGEMSLVGACPPTLDEVRTYSKGDWQHLSIKPGMTGLWQLSGSRYEVSFDKAIELDILYISHWRLQLDIQVLACTAIRILSGGKGGQVKVLWRTGEQKRVRILNILIDNISMDELLKNLRSGVVLTPNVDHVMKLQRNLEFFKIYNLANYKVCDSKILLCTSRVLGTPLKEKISGSDLLPVFCQFHKNNEDIKVFLLGGDKGVAERARVRINKKTGRDIVIGALSPSFSFEKDEQECLDVVEKINHSGATVLAVGLGAPKQEKWIFKYRHKLSTVRIFLAIGAAIDFEAGVVKRAPKWMSSVGTEWLYRLLLEPKRLWKRYFIDDIPFFWLVFKQRFGFYAAPPFIASSNTAAESNADELYCKNPSLNNFEE